MCGGSYFKLGNLNVGIYLGDSGGRFSYNSDSKTLERFDFCNGENDSVQLESFLLKFSKEEIIKGIVDMLQNGQEF